MIVASERQSRGRGTAYASRKEVLKEDPFPLSTAVQQQRHAGVSLCSSCAHPAAAAQDLLFLSCSLLASLCLTCSHLRRRRAAVLASTVALAKEEEEEKQERRREECGGERGRERTGGESSIRSSRPAFQTLVPSLRHSLDPD